VVDRALERQLSWPDRFDPGYVFVVPARASAVSVGVATVVTSFTDGSIHELVTYLSALSPRRRCSELLCAIHRCDLLRIGVNI